MDEVGFVSFCIEIARGIMCLYSLALEYGFQVHLYSRGVIDSYSVVHTLSYSSPAIVMPFILSIRPMGRYTHF